MRLPELPEPPHKIDRIRLYKVDGQQIGIGYYNGKLVEFMELENGKIKYEEITVVQSVEWIEKMHYSHIRLNVVSVSFDAGRFDGFVI